MSSLGRLATQCLLILSALPLESSLYQLKARADAVPVTMCEIVNNPKRFSGKVIKVRATVKGSRAPTVEEPSFSPQPPCAAEGYMVIILETPDHVKPRPDFDLQRDLSYNKFREAQRKSARIEATLEGRFDVTYVWLNKERIRVGEGEGYGKNHKADARIILYRISEVESRYLPNR